MNTKAALKTIVLLGVIGTIFSGYLTYYTFTHTISGCELYILGLPSCFYGALIYTAVFVLSMALVFNRSSRSKKAIALSVIAFVGIMFASFLTWYVLSARSCTSFEIFGLPPCVFGLAMYVAVLVLSILGIADKRT
jgi:uncharacterized membrane protein